MKTFLLGTLVGLLGGVMITLVFVDHANVENSPASSTTTTQPSEADRILTNKANTVAANSTPRIGASNTFATRSISNDASKSAATNSTTSTGTSVNSSPQQNANAAPANPIRITDAHRQLLDNNKSIENGMTLAQRHDALGGEDVDAEWSYYMEDQLNRFFASHAPPLRVDIANITCRTTACEIQAFMDGEPQALMMLVKAAQKEPWWDFAGGQANTDDYQGRERGIVFLQRKLQSNQVQSPKTEKDLASSKVATRT